MIPKTTTYYGKKYGLVYESGSVKKANIYANTINTVFGDYSGQGEKIRKILQNMKHLVLLDHLKDKNGIETHCIYVKQPYDKLIKRI